MDVMLGILGLAIFIGIVVLMQKGMNSLGKKANQNVFARKGHREGQELVTQRLVFSTHASLDEVKKAVLSVVKAAPSEPAVLADAYLIEATGTHILYGYGNKFKSRNFVGMLDFKPTESGTQGSWEIIKWTLADGIVVGQPVMKRLIADINTALRSVDPKTSLRLAGNGSGNGVMARGARPTPVRVGGSQH